MPTPAMYKITIKTIHSSHLTWKFKLELTSVGQLVPVFVSTEMAGQLDVPGLNSVPLGMDGKEIGIFHHAHQVALLCLMKGIHSSLGPTWAKCSSSSAFNNCVGSISFSPFLLLHSCILMCLISLKNTANYKYIHVSPMSLTCILFTTLHCVHVSLMSLTYIPITVQRNHLPYKWQPGNAQFCGPLKVLYFSQSLGA